MLSYSIEHNVSWCNKQQGNCGVMKRSNSFGDVVTFNLVYGITRLYIYLITLTPRNITSQLQCISASAAGTSAIPVTDE